MEPIINFIRTHRTAFDTALPGAHGWKSVEKALDRLKTADALERELVYNRLLLDTEEASPRLWFAIEAELDACDAPTVEAGRQGSLERFISGHREAFDSAQPSAALWSTIEQGLSGSAVESAPLTSQRGGKSALRATPSSWRRSLLRVAASLALLISGVGIGWWLGYGTAQDAMTMSQVSREYAALEQQYQQEIASKTAQLVSFGGQPADVTADLDQIDRVMQELQHELADVPPGNREQVVRAMIENYQVKAAILQRVLERLEQTKSNSDPTNRAPNHEVNSI